MFANTEYGPGQVTTEVGGLPTVFDPSAYLKALLRAERARRPSYGSRPATGGLLGGSSASRVAAAPVQQERPVVDPLVAQAQQAAARDAILTQKAKERGPLKKWVTVGNQTFLTATPQDENAYGRQFYVPQSATIQTSAADAERAREDLLSDLAFQQKFDSGIRTANMGSPGGREQANWWGLKDSPGGRQQANWWGLKD